MPWLGNALGAFGTRPAHVVNPPYDPPVETTTFDVTSYGADKNGAVACQSAVQSAYNAARANSAGGAHSTVYFPPGTYRFSDKVTLGTMRTNDYVGQSSPNYQQRGTVAFSGYNATIKYDNVTTKFCWLQSPNVTTESSQFQTIGNLVVEGFTIDNNYRQPSSSCGTVFWTSGAYNVDNVIFRDITMTRNFYTRTTTYTATNAGGITIRPGWLTWGQNWTYLTNISVLNCELYGQSKPLAILSDANPYAYKGATPILVDNIYLADSSFDNFRHYGSNAHIGGQASGYRLTVERCHFENSSDDGLEINAFNEVHVTDCTFTKNRQPVCLTWFSFPYKTDTPHYHMKGNDYYGDCNPYWLAEVTPEPAPRPPMLPEYRLYANDSVYAPLLARYWGHLIIEDQTMEYGFTNVYGSSNSPITVGSNGIPFSSVYINNCDFTDKQGSSSRTFIDVRQRTGYNTLPITITDCRWRNTTDGSYALLNSNQVYLSGSRSLTTDIPGLT